MVGTWWLHVLAHVCLCVCKAVRKIDRNVTPGNNREQQDNHTGQPSALSKIIDLGTFWDPTGTKTGPKIAKVTSNADYGKSLALHLLPPCVLHAACWPIRNVSTVPHDVGN